MSVADLQLNGLYIVLFVRSHPPLKDDFHWGLYFHKHILSGGTKYHIKTAGNGWIADHGTSSAVLNSFLLIGLFQISDVPAGCENDVDQSIRSLDARINEPGITCRVWVIKVLELLNKPNNGHVILRCNDLISLEGEVKAWGNEHAPEAAKNHQPRPIGASQICGL